MLLKQQRSCLAVTSVSLVANLTRSVCRPSSCSPKDRYRDGSRDMSEEILDTELSNLVLKASEEVYRLLQHSRKDIDRVFLIQHAMAEKNSIAAALKSSLLTNSAFGRLQNGWVSTPNMGILIQDHVIPTILLSVCLEGGNVDDAIAGIRGFAKQGESAPEFHAALVGVSLSVELVLSDSVSIVPWTSLPEAEREHFETSFASIASRPMRVRLEPSAAVVRVKLPSRRVLFASHDDAAQEDRKMGQAEVEAAMQTALDIVRCCVIFTGRPVAVLCTWLKLSDIWADRMSPKGYSYTDAIFDLSLSGEDTDITLSEVPILFRALQKHALRDKDALRLSTDRLGMCLRRPGLVDKSIELGIALECVILNELDSQGELSYRIAMRGAAYLGESAIERREIFSHLRTVYSLRSKAVHTGSLSLKPATNASAVEALRIGTELAGRILRKVLLAAKFPEWESYIFGVETS